MPLDIDAIIHNFARADTRNKECIFLMLLPLTIDIVNILRCFLHIAHLYILLNINIIVMACIYINSCCFVFSLNFWCDDLFLQYKCQHKFWYILQNVLQMRRYDYEIFPKILRTTCRKVPSKLQEMRLYIGFENLKISLGSIAPDTPRKMSRFMLELLF